MRATIQRWGNSLALRIPALLAKEISVGEGDAVEVEVSEGGLSVKPAHPSYKAEELIGKITPQNLHGETEWGAASGREVW